VTPRRVKSEPELARSCRTSRVRVRACTPVERIMQPSTGLLGGGGIRVSGNVDGNSATMGAGCRAQSLEAQVLRATQGWVRYSRSGSLMRSAICVTSSKEGRDGRGTCIGRRRISRRRDLAVRRWHLAVMLKRADGRLVVISDEDVTEYALVEAFDEGKEPRSLISLR